MAKKFPRFLISDPTNVKFRGPFIVHTLEPQFICRPEFDEKRHVVDCFLLETFGNDNLANEASEIMKEIPEWYKHSGIHQSNHAEDKLLSEIGGCEFLKDHLTHYSVEDARKIIRILFPTKAKKIYEGSSSYGIKHLFEHISETISGLKFSTKKYCSNNTVIEAFEKEGFRMKEEGLNRYMNLLASEINRAKKLFWNY
jgi:hypothetical protein